MKSGFERMTSGVTRSVISLKFCTKSFENVHLTCENSIKPIKKKKTNYIIDVFQCLIRFGEFLKALKWMDATSYRDAKKINF